GELLAQPGWQLASDRRSGYGPHTAAHPDVLLVVPRGYHDDGRDVPVWALPATQSLRARQGLSLVLLLPDRRFGHRDDAGGLQRVGPQLVDPRRDLRGAVPLALRPLWLARRRDIRAVGGNSRAAPRHREGGRGLRRACEGCLIRRTPPGSASDPGRR